MLHFIALFCKKCKKKEVCRGVKGKQCHVISLLLYHFLYYLNMVNKMPHITCLTFNFTITAGGVKKIPVKWIPSLFILSTFNFTIKRTLLWFYHQICSLLSSVLFQVWLVVLIQIYLFKKKKKASEVIIQSCKLGNLAVDGSHLLDPYNQFDISDLMAYQPCFPFPFVFPIFPIVYDL